jgi:trimeric autotransporter adhesin
MYSPVSQFSAFNVSSSRRLLRNGLLFVVVSLGLLAVSPLARAVTPPPDGGYPNENTAEGEDALFNLNANGQWNTAVGYRALYSATSAYGNTAIGARALYNVTYGEGNTAVGLDALFNNTIGRGNTAIGTGALLKNTQGGENTACGNAALAANTTGANNTANGVGALFSNTTGSGNTAIGFEALDFNTTGSNNTATGVLALSNNTTGGNNTATGVNALQNNKTGDNNTANGVDALFNNTTGVQNTAAGVNALFGNTAGFNNTANGYQALLSNTTGGNNTANGVRALAKNTTGAFNTASGINALANNATGKNNIALGYIAGANLTTGSNNIDIAAFGMVGESNTIRIGVAGKQTATYIAGISGVTVAGGVGVIIDTKGHLGTVVSSERFKDEIKPMDKASEAILTLEPVTFRYKEELDPDSIPQFGLIAEQVEKVNPNLVVRGEDGKVITVRYEAVNAMLLNEFLKEHRRVEEQGATIVQMKKQIEALTAGLQKVSAQLELNKPAPQLMADNQ